MLEGRRIVCLSSLPWHWLPTSRHHIARELAKTNEILYVDPPLNVARRPSRAALFGQLVEDDVVMRYQPPGHLPYGPAPVFAMTTPINQRVYARGVAGAVRHLGWHHPILWNASI